MLSATHKDKRKNVDVIEDEIENAMEDDDTDTESTSERKFHYVMTASKNKRVPLPAYIKIDNPYPGEPPFMKKRNKPAVVRFHKPKKDVDPAKYFFAEALLYTPFRSEKELEQRVENAAQDGYKELELWINAVKSQIMEHLESNEEARYMVEEANKKIEEIGDILDPHGEQENNDCNLEEPELFSEYEHRKRPT